MMVDNPIETFIMVGCSVTYDVPGTYSALQNSRFVYPVLSYATYFERFRDIVKYPFFYRINMSYVQFTSTIYNFLKRMGWGRISIHLERSVQDKGLLETLIEEDPDMSMLHVSIFDTFQNTKDFMRANNVYMANLRSLDAKIAVVNYMLQEKGIIFLCELLSAAKVDTTMVWFLEKFLIDTILSKGEICEGIPSSDLARINIFSPEQPLAEEEIFHQYMNMTSSEFNLRMETRINNTDRFNSIFTTFAYDSVWTGALALNKFVTRNNISSNNFNNILSSMSRSQWAEEFGELLMETDYIGVSGRIKFDENHQVNPVMAMYQYQGGKEMTIISKLTFDTNGTAIWIDVAPIKWAGGKKPLDYTPIVVVNQKITLMQIPRNLLIVMSSITAVCFSIVLLFLFFNIWNRKHPYIRMTSPTINNFILVGCVLMLISVVTQGIDTQYITEDIYIVFCQLNLWLPSLGFTIAFGALFSKTFRVYKIFTSKQKVTMNDNQLMTFIFVMLFFDVLMLIAWQFQSPYHYFIINMYEDTKPINATLIERYTYQKEICSAKSNTLLFANFGVKALLLIFGSFLAFETRKVRIAALNDSQQIGICVYNTIVMALIGVLVTLFIDNNPPISYFLLSFVEIFSVVTTSCLIFGSKIVLVIRDPKGEKVNIRTSATTQVTTITQGQKELMEKIAKLESENKALRNE